MSNPVYIIYTNAPESWGTPIAIYDADEKPDLLDKLRTIWAGGYYMAMHHMDWRGGKIPTPHECDERVPL